MGLLPFSFAPVSIGRRNAALSKPLSGLWMATRQSASIMLVLTLASCGATDDKAALKDETGKLWAAVLDGIAECDSAATTAAGAMGGGSTDIYEAYRLATRAESACRAAVPVLAALKPPEHAKGDVRKAFKDALNACTQAATAKQLTMSAAAEVVNGDSSPKTVNRAAQQTNDALASSFRCGALFIAATDKAGLELPELKKRAKLGV
jgi:hypothetical protein